MIIRNKSRRYRLTETEAKMLDQLKKYHIKESHFVRQAIREKFARDLPKIKEHHNKIKLPF